MNQTSGIISYVMPDGLEKSIVFGSHTLLLSEHNYSQLDKEAFFLIFSVKKFHKFLYGWHFTIITDHKPLTSILSHKKEIPSLAAVMLQKWAILLSAYYYNVQYCPISQHNDADMLSHLPQQHPLTMLEVVVRLT